MTHAAVTTLVTIPEATARTCSNTQLKRSTCHFQTCSLQQLTNLFPTTTANDDIHLNHSNSDSTTTPASSTSTATTPPQTAALTAPRPRLERRLPPATTRTSQILTQDPPQPGSFFLPIVTRALTDLRIQAAQNAAPLQRHLHWHPQPRPPRCPPIWHFPLPRLSRRHRSYGGRRYGHDDVVRQRLWQEARG